MIAAIKISIIVTDLTVYQAFSSMGVDSIVYILNLVLIIFLIFMVIYYATVFKWHIPKSVIFVNILLIIPIIYAFYMFYGGIIGMATLSTALSYFLAIILIIITFNAKRTGHFYIGIGEIIILIIFFIVAAFGLAMTPYSAYTDGTVDTSNSSEEIEGVEEASSVEVSNFSSPYEIYANESTKYGDMLITTGYEWDYFVYLTGDINVTGMMYDEYYDLTFTHMDTGEAAHIYYMDEYGKGVSFENRTYDSSSGTVNVCSGFAPVTNITEASVVLTNSNCFVTKN